MSDVQDFVLENDTEPPPGCTLLGTYRVGTRSRRGQLVWEELAG